MPIVTKMIKQKKNKEYYNIYIDGEYSFSMHEELVILYEMKKGKYIDIEKMSEIIYEDNKKRAFNRALHYLSYRRRTQWEIEEYLKKKGFNEKIVELTIEKLKYYNLIDDEDYIKSYIAQKKSGNPIGRKKLLFDLEKKGIDNCLFDQIDQYYTQEEEYEQAKKLALKYNKKYEKISSKERIYKIGQAGQRRGFSWEIMKNVIQEIVEKDQEEEKQYQQQVDKQKALEWGEKYKKRYEKQGLVGLKLKQKITQILRIRGYPWEVIEKVLTTILDEEK
ncbi:RecX family transcriptional regulator [Garciella nitratireducens]|uniref:RecX family transcriptional regulator n=1 Tax=Garciella nitratireducens TaxID=218205 RepID=UPI000DEA8B8B|nr:RecX family transcriptional regulator [Garciella nitratireducens]RBP36162.1 regulatory protein [Garciella nitratireducens]